MAQGRMAARGATLMHVTWSETSGSSIEQQSDDLATVLEAYLDGKYTRLELFDRPQSPPP